jgi:hypothetical protein
MSIQPKEGSNSLCEMGHLSKPSLSESCGSLIRVEGEASSIRSALLRTRAITAGVSVERFSGFLAIHPIALLRFAARRAVSTRRTTILCDTENGAEGQFPSVAPSLDFRRRRS